MKVTKAWIAVAAVALTVGAGACGTGGKSTAQPGTTATTHAASGTKSSTPAAPSPKSSTAAASPSATATKPNTPPPLTPQAAAQMILGITSQIQQAENTPNGPKALTRAQAEAIVNAQNKALGLPTLKQ